MRGRMSTKKKDNNKNKITQASLTMRILAGGYLFYLVYQLIRGLPESSPNSRIVSLAGIVVFLLLGIFLLGHSFYLLKTKGYDKSGENEDNEDNGKNQQP